ncbi:MAG: MurR/RpiR family transcriptional regulator [Acidobacteriia bacterium]|jgi:DNA-binding MurR/RpiR family transcriptional regulator|nr:MurR/RpiR family transcriptional regulator [Terriglobia bacterium]
MARRPKYGASGQAGRPHLPSVSDLLARLSRRRRELIRPVLEHPREFVLLSVRGLAERLRTDPATTLRIVQSMGFASFRDFQRYLHELAVIQATPFDLMRDATARDSDIPSHIRGTLDRDLRNLQGLRHSIDAEAALRLARRLYAARRILIFGGDLAISLVHFLHYNFSILGLPAFSGTTPGLVSHLVRTADRRDVVLAISFRRGLRQTVEGLKQARAKGAYCVGITDTFVSPVARYSHECFLASIDSPSFAGSYVAPMALLNVLIVACANYRRARTLSLLHEANKEQLSGFRWYREV